VRVMDGVGVGDGRGRAGDGRGSARVLGSIYRSVLFIVRKSRGKGLALAL
jgi:hypothetical protein